MNEEDAHDPSSELCGCPLRLYPSPDDGSIVRSQRRPRFTRLPSRSQTRWLSLPSRTIRGTILYIQARDARRLRSTESGAKGPCDQGVATPRVFWRIPPINTLNCNVMNHGRRTALSRPYLKEGPAVWGTTVWRDPSRMPWTQTFPEYRDA
jgi:hypothetical protein